MPAKGQIRLPLTGEREREMGSVFEHGQTYYAGRLSDNVFLIAGHGYLWNPNENPEDIMFVLCVWNIHSHYDFYTSIYTSAVLIFISTLHNIFVIPAQKIAFQLFTEEVKEDIGVE